MYVCSHVTDKTAEVIRLLLIGDPYISIRFEGQRSKVNAAGTKREILNFHLLAWVSKSIECPQDDDDDDDNEGFSCLFIISTGQRQQLKTVNRNIKKLRVILPGDAWLRLMIYLTTNQSALSIPSSFSVSASVTVASIAVELQTSPELNRRITNAAAAIIIIIIIITMKKMKKKNIYSKQNKTQS